MWLYNRERAASSSESESDVESSSESGTRGNDQEDAFDVNFDLNPINE